MCERFSVSVRSVHVSVWSVKTLPIYSMYVFHVCFIVCGGLIVFSGEVSLFHCVGAIRTSNGKGPEPLYALY